MLSLVSIGMTVLPTQAEQDRKSRTRGEDNPALEPTLRFATLRHSCRIALPTRAGFSDPARLGWVGLAQSNFTYCVE